MTHNLQEAKRLLSEKEYTCVLCKQQTVYTSKKRGILPLVEWADSQIKLSGFSAADKIVGKAAAFIYIYLGVKEVYAPVMSRTAADLLTANGIQPFFDVCTKEIINRTNTGRCPMECAVDTADNALEALSAVKKILFSNK